MRRTTFSLSSPCLPAWRPVSAELHAGAVFLRIHRSTHPELGRLREVHPYAKNTCILVLIDGTHLTSFITYRACIEGLISG